MNRRGFFGLLGKLLAVGSAMSVAPAILKPVEKAVQWSGATCHLAEVNCSGTINKEFAFHWPKWMLAS